MSKTAKQYAAELRKLKAMVARIADRLDSEQRAHAELRRLVTAHEHKGHSQRQIIATTQARLEQAELTIVHWQDKALAAIEACTP